jgi:hypothetical protein
VALETCRLQGALQPLAVQQRISTVSQSNIKCNSSTSQVHKTTLDCAVASRSSRVKVGSPQMVLSSLAERWVITTTCGGKISWWFSLMLPDFTGSADALFAVHVSSRETSGPGPRTRMKCLCSTHWYLQIHFVVALEFHELAQMCTQWLSYEYTEFWFYKVYWAWAPSWSITCTKSMPGRALPISDCGMLWSSFGYVLQPYNYISTKRAPAFPTVIAVSKAELGSPSVTQTVAEIPLL